MTKSDVWKALKTPKFEQIGFFEGRGCSGMSKMHSWGVSNMFEKFLNLFHIFITFGPFSAKILKFLGPKWAQNGQIWCMENPEKPKI